MVFFEVLAKTGLSYIFVLLFALPVFISICYSFSHITDVLPGNRNYSHKPENTVFSSAILLDNFLATRLGIPKSSSSSQGLQTNI